MALNPEVMSILHRFHVQPINEEFYIEALTHSSYVNENNGTGVDYQRLEFVGDAVLQLTIADLIYENTSFAEGEMTLLRSNLVRQETLAELGFALGLDKVMLLGHGEDKNGGRTRPSLLGDVFEAFIGALYLDIGYDRIMKIVQELFTPLLNDYVENKMNKIKDPKTLFQEYIQADQPRMIKYELIHSYGPANQRVFEVQARIDDVVYGQGSGNSKKIAEQEAAKDALSKIAKSTL